MATLVERGARRKPRRCPRIRPRPSQDTDKEKRLKPFFLEVKRRILVETRLCYGSRILPDQIALLQFDLVVMLFGLK